MSKKFLAALIILPILALGSYVALRLHQAKQAEQMAVLIDAEGGNVNFDDDKILFFIPSRKADSVHIDCASDRWREQFEGLWCFPKLRSLYLMGCPVKDKDLKLLSHLKDLKELDLSGTNVTDAGMAELARLPSLELLSVSLTFVSSDGVRQLPERVDVAATGSKIDPTTLPGRTLSVPEGPVAPDALITLCRKYEQVAKDTAFVQKAKSGTRGKPHLTQFYFNPDSLNQQERQQAIELIAEIMTLSNLRVILIQYELNPHSETKENSLSFDTALSELCKLELTNLTPSSNILTPEQIDEIWQCRTLEVVSFTGSLPESISLPANLREAYFGDCTDLKSIHLQEDLRILELRDYAELKSIDIVGTESALKKFSLTGSLPADGLKFLSKCPKLEELTILKYTDNLDLDAMGVSLSYKCTAQLRVESYAS